LVAEAGGSLAAAVVEVAEVVQSEVAVPVVGDDRGAWFHVISDEAVQRLRRPIRERCHPAPAETLRPSDLDRDASQHLLAACPSAAQPGLLTTKEGRIHLRWPSQPVAARTHQRRPQSVRYRPGPLVRADLRLRCTVRADTPSLLEANIQHAVNHTVSGVRVRSKIVPAVTADNDGALPTDPQRHTPSRDRRAVGSCRARSAPAWCHSARRSPAARVQPRTHVRGQDDPARAGLADSRWAYPGRAGWSSPNPLRSGAWPWLPPPGER